MTRGVYKSPYQPLNLTPDEIAELHDTASQLLDEIQAQYENHKDDTPASFDSGRWDLIRESNGIRVYHDRRSSEVTKSESLHRLVAVGSIAGTLNDAMYGELNHTTMDMRVRTAYVKDTLVDCAVLTSILEPTEANPFQSMTVRWLVKAVPFYLRPVTRHRDNVILEATGLRRLSTGENVGYRLMHPISSPYTPPLDCYDRRNISICTIWRELSPQRLHVFRAAYVEITESSAVVAPLALRSSVDAIISVERVVECALRKKLAFVVRNNLFSELQGSISSDGCSVCSAHNRSTSHGGTSRCQACLTTMCHQCRVKRDLVVRGSDHRLRERKMRFCVSCLLKTTQLDAASIAREEQRAERPATSSGRFVHFTSDHSMSSRSSISTNSDSKSFRFL